MRALPLRGRSRFGGPYNERSPVPGAAAPGAPHNVDAGELDKFAALAHQWWDPESSMFGPLHKMNPLRLDWIDREGGGLAGKRVVDVGCGGGILTEAMAARGATTLGIDLGDKALSVARLHKLESGTTAEYRLIAADALAREMPGAFDIVTCMEMLEHVPDPAGIVAACAALARPGGTRRSVDHRPQSQVVRAGRGRGGIHPRTVAQRHARLREVPATGRSRLVRAPRRAAACGHHRHDLQPAHEDVPAGAGYEGQLHDGVLS
jgi:SAM-dependent methyltransferase